MWDTNIEIYIYFYDFSSYEITSFQMDKEFIYLRWRIERNFIFYFQLERKKWLNLKRRKIHL
jgi:hypothetical protein